MERYTMFLNWKDQHCENDYTIQSNLQIQCNPYQTTTGIFHRTRTKNCTICMETQKTLNSQNNLEKEKWSYWNQALRLQILFFKDRIEEENLRTSLWNESKSSLF